MSYKTNSHISNSKRKTSSNLPSPKKPQEKGGEKKISLYGESGYDAE